MNGIYRFEYFLSQLEKLLQQSTHSHNPGLWLYQNNARTPLFMLEGLAKSYAELHNKKKFTKLKDHFKILEDGIGAIDHYDNVAREMEKVATVPASITAYLKAQAIEKLQSLNEKLVENKWIGDDAGRIDKTRKKLKEADWLEPGKEVKKIESFYRDELSSIKESWQKTGGRFTEMELHVHEFRRDLRWLSIYPQAFRGMIQLKDSGIVDFNTDKYLTSEIVTSPYNKMPAPGDHKIVLQLERQYFLSLSWLIAKLGTLKDLGLKIFAVAEAIQQTENLPLDSALTKSFSYLNCSPDWPERILQEATSVCRMFFEENIADRIVAGISEN